MLGEIPDIIDGKREVMLFAPTITFGYLSAINNNVGFLVFAALSSIAPMVVIGPEKPPEERLYTKFGKVFFYLVGVPWFVGYPFGVYFLWLSMNETNIIFVGLFLFNFLTMVLFTLPFSRIFEHEVKWF